MAWGIFISGMAHGRGPFQKKDRTGWYGRLVRRGVLLFPLGAPRPTTVWRLSRDATFDQVLEFMGNIVARNSAIPNIARWNTIETSPHYIVALLCLGILRPIFNDCDIGFWPGGDSAADHLDDEKDTVSREMRAQRVGDFRSSPDILRCSIVRCVTSIPRRHLLRSMRKTTPALMANTSESPERFGTVFTIRRILPAQATRIQNF